MPSRIFTALALLAACIVAIIFALAPDAPGRVVYRGGEVITLDPTDRVVSALATEGSRIVAVGDDAAVAPWLDGARIVELGGRTLLPGFIDAHGHFPGSGIFAVAVDLNSPPIGDIGSIEDLVERLRLRADDTREGEWVIGMGYDDSLVAEGRHPTRDDLDRVSEHHPVGIVHISGHLGVANSAALERIGVGPDTPDPTGGRIRRDATGAPTGVLEETALDPLSREVLNPSLPDAWRIVRRATDRYLEQGVTTAQVGQATALMVRGIDWLSRLGLLPLRVVLWPDPETTDALLAGEIRIGSRPQWVRAGAVKLVADGSIQGYTGYLSEPYFVPPGDDPSYRGYPVIARDALAERVGHYHAAGRQVAVHGNGDASIDDILDAFEAALAAEPRPDSRPVIVHAQMARDDQLDRMRTLGVVPSFFVLHTFYWGDRHRERFMGPERAARMSPTRSAAERGIPFTIHADAPVVPMEPLRLVWSAVQRRTRSDVVVGPSERIDVMRALRATTIDAAHQHFEEADKGSLEVGKLADLVILERSPLADPQRLDEIRVDATIIAGRTVFDRPHQRR